MAGDGGAATPADTGVAVDSTGAPAADPNATVAADPNAAGTAQQVVTSGAGIVAAAEADNSQYKLAADVVGSVDDTRLAGIGILVALVALGFFCLAFGEVRQQLFGRRRP